MTDIKEDNKELFMSDEDIKSLLNIVVYKNKEERNNPDIEETSEFNNILRIKYFDDNFFIEKCNIRKLYQDAYNVSHDIIADLFYKQINNKSYAYTSSSCIAGHHNLNTSGVLIFRKGEMFYVFDDEEDQEDFLNDVYNLEWL